MRVLVVNAGSSSLKLRVLGAGDEVLFSEDLSTPRARLDRDALSAALGAAGEVDAIGHRIVHGGTEFTAPVLIDDIVVARLRALTDLAPLHQPKSLAALEAVRAAAPGVPAVACFDTAFHAGLPAAAATYALPSEWRKRWGLRRFGFHGLSHAWAAGRAAELLERPPAELRLVTCHLGAGASLAAVNAGCSVDTTMGFTPLEGLAMATRSGSVDPGLVLWLQEHVGTPPAELAATLEHRSGMLGLAGTADMRAILAAATDEAGASAGGERGHGDGAASEPAVDRGVPRHGAVEPGDARLALGVYLHRLRGGIAAMAAAMNGLDALVFTGGVGENAPRVRQMAVDGLGFLGLAVDPRLNAQDGQDRDVSAEPSSARTLVVASREDVEIARQVRGLLDPAHAPEASPACPASG